MTYPGNPELSAQAQERVMSAFRQVVAKIQDGLSSEALIGLEFVLRLDPTFAPGVAIQEQLINGQSDIDLSSIISQLEAPDTDAINLLLIEAVEDFNQHKYLEARDKVEKVLIDLPGHAEARSLAGQIEDSLKVATQVGQFLTQAKEALAENRPQDAANFVLMAQALDPHHSGIDETLAEINRVGASVQNVSVPLPVEQESVTSPPPPPAAVAFESPPAPQMNQPSFEEPGPAEGSFAVSEGFSTEFEQQAESDSWDVAGAFEEPAFEAEQSPVQPPPESAGFEFGGDVADLFEASSDTAEDSLWQAPEPPSDDQPEDADPIQDLLARGTAALESGDPQEALHNLSRILLLDPENTEAAELIDRARTAIDAMEIQLQASISEAELAWDSSDKDRARAIVEEILFARPDHEEAVALQARFSSADVGDAEPLESPIDPLLPPVPLDVPPVEDVHENDISLIQDFDSAFDQLGTDPPDMPIDAPQVPTGGRRIPWRWVIFGGCALVVVLAGMWLGSSFLQTDEEDIDTARVVSERIENAQSLFDQGKGGAALELLRSFEVDGIDKQRVDKHIARFEAALTPPTPTPIPESVALARSMMDDGRWLEAYQVVDAGLSQHPGDSGLLSLNVEIAEIEPRVGSLFGALAKLDFQAGSLLAGELEARHPNQPGFGEVLDRCLFNAALTHLRSYNMSGARGHLQRLQERHPHDEDVARILNFVSRYSNRPVDMQLEIFVGSLDYR